MMRIYKGIATSLGIGYMGKGGGTVAAVAACLCWYGLQVGNKPVFLNQVAATLLLTAAGIWVGNKVESVWGKDNKKVVIDEVAGMCISLLFLPVTLPIIIAGLVLFRYFDIAKPLFISKAESLPGGWGVMADDVMAGIYTNVLLQVAVKLNWL